MKKMILKSIVFLFMISTVAFAASIPNSGNILQQVKSPVLSPVPKELPKVQTQEYAPAISGKGGVKILVKHFIIKGNTVFPSALLHELIKSYENNELTLSQIKKVADVITKYYRDHGYFVSRAYVPAQTIKNNTVVIMIIEGNYGSFNLNNTSLVKTAILQNHLNALKKAHVISLSSMEHQMLLINDLSGAKITNIQIGPGKKIGQSDFNIDIEATKRFNSYLFVDNYGSKATGEGRVTAMEMINSPTGLGDRLQIIGLESFSSELKNAQAKYSLPLGISGLKADISASVTKYTIGDIYKSLDAHGDTSMFTAGLSYPMIKTRVTELNLKGTLSHTGMSDWMSGSDAKKHVNAIILSLEGSHNGNFFSKPNRFSADISFTRGQSILDNAAAIYNDATLNSAGNFNKALLNMTNSLYLDQKTTLKMTLSAQTSFNKNLDSSEDFSVGGAYGLRAYTTNELSGDKGVLFSLEAIYALPSMQNLQQQSSLFLDSAKVWQNASNISGSANNVRRLNDIGISYSATYRAMSLSVSYAHGFGVDSQPTAELSTSADKVFARLSMVF
ncbi:MAG: ShlB/FhaC/HecB family hemolysin secretion/activation protein [Sulfurospirillaceae bacterium]|nr:ShlB/FhaC/HecB family hemolysin secretion/activation protein [Sulfurospirillaceae bacterium]